MVSSTRILEKVDECATMEEEDLLMWSTKKVKENQKEKGSGDDVSYVDKLLKPIGGNMEDVVPMDGVKDSGVLDEVPKESLSSMD